MKKYFFAFILIIVIGTRLNAQSSVQAYTQMFDSLLQFSPSGLLLDRSPYALLSEGTSINPANWQYGSDSIATDRIFKEMHRIFYYTSADTQAFNFNPQNYEDSLDVALYGTIRRGLSGEQQFDLKPSADVILGVLHANQYENTK